MTRSILFAALLTLSGLSLTAQKKLPAPPRPAAASALKIDYEKFKLSNGLEVIFHIDRSDPVVAVALTAHVGSAREKTGRTGFAHLFEHLLFLESENLGKGGLDAMSARVGGSGANGSTNRDRTNYYQTVPKDALEKMLWAEADKLGWFINTVTEPVLAKEKQVVKNEKRQSYDNRPYGHTSYVIGKQLYPADHPYNWQVIGSLEDVQNATLADVKEFYRRWYVPNNVTLVVAGDFDVAQARSWVQKYFGEIAAGPAVTAMAKRPGTVKETVKLFHEDNFAQLPELTMAWPGVEDYHPDAYALQILSSYLSQGKKAPLYQVLVEKDKLTDEVTMYNDNSELAGEIQLSVRAFEGQDLDSVAMAVREGLGRFERTGIPQKDLDRIKAGLETAFYSSLSSVEGKGFQLAQYNIFTGNPGFLSEDFRKLQAVTTADVKRVYDKYIRNKPYVATSFVPKGAPELALEGSGKADIVEEQVAADADDKVDPKAQADYAKTPSTFDRSKEPQYGPTPGLTTPKIWNRRLSNGMQVYGIESNEVPLVQFDIVVDGGLLLEDTGKVGVANMMADLLTQGTRRRTPQELEEAIELLGATITVDAGVEEIRIRVNTLARNYAATLALVEEILLEPRWDTAEFELVRESTISQIQQQAADPNSIAANAYNLLIYGKDNIRSRNILGTEQTVKSITIDDLKAFYNRSLSPTVARMHVVGALGEPAIISSLNSLAAHWQSKPVNIPAWKTPLPPSKPLVYFYDVPDAKQSVIRLGYPALAATDKDYYPAIVMNYILGGGGFASRLTQQLREEKGYTYGISSGFSGTASKGPFVVGSGVRSNVTLESAQLVTTILQQYPETFSEQDLQTTKSSLVKSNARAFETVGAKLGMLNNISKYGWKYDYIKEREAIVGAMTVEQIKALSGKYLNTDHMIWLVVGDAKTQLPRLKDLGYGEPLLLKP